MNKFFYFMAVGLAFTALQVATVEADHEAAHMAPPMCPGPLGTMIPCPAPGDGGPPPCPEGTVCDPCISLETQALRDACHAEQ